MSKSDIYAGIDLGKTDKNLDKFLLVAVTEKRTKKQMDRFVKVLKEVL